MSDKAVRMTWFKFYAIDWLTSPLVRSMTLEARGAYLELLVQQSLNGRWTISADERHLAQMSGLGDRWSEYRDLLLEAFPLHPTQEGRRANPRMTLVLEESNRVTTKVREQRRIAGQASATARQRAVDESPTGRYKRRGDKSREEIPPIRPLATVESGVVDGPDKPDSGTSASSGSTPVGGRGSDGGEPPGFAEFWIAYPRKVAKPAAIKAFKAALAKSDHATIIKGLETAKHSAQWTRDGGQFIPHPATWLNQERWNDAEPEVANVVSLNGSGSKHIQKQPEPDDFF